MSLISGPISCRAYVVSTPPSRDFLVEGIRDVQRHAFRPLQTDRGQSRSIGWVNPRNLLDTRLSAEKIQFADYIVLGLRIDRVGLNSRVLKAYYAEAAREAQKERRGQGLSREERVALLEKVKLDLLNKQTPATAVYEMAWNTRTSRVYFSATGNALNLEFCDLFSDTFHTSLTPLFPFLRAEEKAGREGLAQALLESLPARFSAAIAHTGEASDGAG